MDDAQRRRECIAGFRVTMRRASSSDNPMRIVTLNVFGEGPSRAFGRRVLCVPHESAGRGISLRAPQTTDHDGRFHTACPEKSRRVAAHSAAPVQPEQRATQRAKRAAAKIVAPLTHTFAAPSAAPPRERLEKCLSSHSPLATRHSPLPFSNRNTHGLEFALTHTKQTTRSRSNRNKFGGAVNQPQHGLLPPSETIAVRIPTACPQNSRMITAAFYSEEARRAAAPVHPELRATQRAKGAASKRLEKCLSSHSPLATRHSPLPFSNRYCLRIEIPVTHTKQTTGNFLIDTQNATFCTKNTARSLPPAPLLSPPLATRLPRAHLAKGHSPLVTPEWYNHPLHPPASNLAGPQAAAGKRKIA